MRLPGANRLRAGFAPKSIGLWLALFGCYYAAARIGLALDAVGGVAATIWPSSGVALAALLLGGDALWSAIAAGAFMAALSADVPLAAAAGIAVGNVLRALVGAGLVRRFAGPGDAALQTVHGVLILVVLGALGSTMISATFGSVSLRLAGVESPSSFIRVWSNWWMGDALGLLIVTPLVLAVPLLRREPWRGLSRLEAPLSMIAVCVVSGLIFGSSPLSRMVMHTYFVFPPLLWAALRLRQPGAALATFLIASIASIGTARGLGPFADAQVARGLISMQAFLSIIALTGLILGAVSSERRRAAEQLLLADRLAAMGTLAAGIAHEINNPLAYLIMCLEMISKIVHRSREQLTNSTQLAELLSVAREGADKMRRIVSDMRTLGRNHDDVRGPVDVHRALESALELALAEIQPRARVIKDYGEVPLVEANQGRLGQVFLNLLINAAQAIPIGQADVNMIQLATRVDSRGRVEVSITDTGGGIELRHRAHLFEPFFTTKPVGEGVGLGLSVCHALVESFGGSIGVETDPGFGTTFRVTLPVSASQPPAETARVTRAYSSTGSALAILIVEDEAHLAESLALLLEEHHVTIALSGRQGLDLCAQREFDLILCDLLMPGVSGIQVYDGLRSVRPGHEQRIVFMTGGAFTLGAQEFLARIPNRTLEKPFDTELLLQLVETIRQGKAGARSAE